MRTKAQINQSIATLLDELSPDELIERILLVHELKKAIAQSDNHDGEDMDDVFDELIKEDEEES